MCFLDLFEEDCILSSEKVYNRAAKKSSSDSSKFLLIS